MHSRAGPFHAFLEAARIPAASIAPLQVAASNGSMPRCHLLLCVACVQCLDEQLEAWHASQSASNPHGLHRIVACLQAVIATIILP